MKQHAVTLGILLAAFIAGCDRQGEIGSPVSIMTDTPASPALASHEPVDRNEQFIPLHNFVHEPIGYPEMYQVTGTITYVMVKNGSDRASDPACNSYIVHFILSGMVGSVAEDKDLWTFDGQQSVNVCLGAADEVIHLSCPLTEREDGVVLRFSLTASTKDAQVYQGDISLNGVWLQAPVSPNPPAGE